MYERGVRHFVAATAVIAVFAYLWVFSRLGYAPIHSDGYSYYVYLPSWVIYRDVTMEALARDWYGGTYPGFTGILRWPTTGLWVNLHPIGTAILMAPFFVAGDLLSLWSNLPRDGFSLYYEHAAGAAGIAYLLAGLAALRRILRRHFSDGVVLATLVAITWGTNLFHYGVFDGTFSHVFAFFLLCCWILIVERWWEQERPTWRLSTSPARSSTRRCFSTACRVTASGAASAAAVEACCRPSNVSNSWRVGSPRAEKTSTGAMVIPPRPPCAPRPVRTPSPGCCP